MFPSTVFPGPYVPSIYKSDILSFSPKWPVPTTLLPIVLSYTVGTDKYFISTQFKEQNYTLNCMLYFESAALFSPSFYISSCVQKADVQYSNFYHAFFLPGCCHGNLMWLRIVSWGPTSACIPSLTP